jgi:ABC-type multidrug transport system fused ATPase/permease subunit
MVFFSILIGGFAAGQIGPGVKAMADARVVAATMMAVIERVPSIGSGDESISNDDHAPNGAKQGGIASDKSTRKRLQKNDVKGEILLEDVHFQYTKLQPQKQQDGYESLEEEHVTNTVFAGCYLTIKAGETVALVGESGEGKTTLTNLLMSFLISKKIL